MPGSIQYADSESRAWVYEYFAKHGNSVWHEEYQDATAAQIAEHHPELPSSWKAICIHAIQGFIELVWLQLSSEEKEAANNLLKIDTLCLESIYLQKVMRFSHLIFGPKNLLQAEHNIVSFGLNSSSVRVKDAQMSMIEGSLHSPKKRKFN